MENKPKVGVGVMIIRDGKILLTRRKGSHGEGQYAFPGGHLEYLESFEDCALRETMEECGSTIKNIKFLFLTNSTKYSPKHYVHIGLTAEWESGEPQVMEPDKAEEWKWYEMDEALKLPLFEFCIYSIDAYKNGKNYYPANSTI